MIDKSENFFVKLIDMLKNPRVLILLFFIIISLVAINYTFDNKGVVINGIKPGSLAEKAGMNFDSTQTPRNFEKIISINNINIENVTSFYATLDEIEKKIFLN